MSDLYKALRLADKLDSVEAYRAIDEAATELRRQHAEIEALKAERDALKVEMERLKGVTRSGSGTATYTGCSLCGIGKDGTAYGYVCPRQDCPIRIKRWGDT
jgi:hypothetical protein